MHEREAGWGHRDGGVCIWREVRICGASGHSLAISSCHRENQLDSQCELTAGCVWIGGSEYILQIRNGTLVSGDWNRQLREAAQWEPAHLHAWPSWTRSDLPAGKQRPKEDSAGTTKEGGRSGPGGYSLNPSIQIQYGAFTLPCVWQQDSAPGMGWPWM